MAQLVFDGARARPVQSSSMSDEAKTAKPKAKRPTDYNQRAFAVVMEAIGEAPKTEPPEKDPAAVKRGRKGGKKGD